MTISRIVVGLALMSFAACGQPFQAQSNSQKPSQIIAASEIGRYQISPIPRTPTDLGSTALILDTKTGDLWKWFEAPNVGNNPGFEGITYMGRAKPGAVGEVVAFHDYH